MAYERYPRGTAPGDYYNDHSARDDGWGGDGYGSSAREYVAAGEVGGGRQRDYGRGYYGDQYSGRPQADWGSDEGRQSFTGGRDYHRGDGGGRRVNVYGDRDRPARGGYGGRQREEDRGFMARAGDEVRSWFGDEDAERRREQDARYDDRHAAGSRDEHYHHWRNEQVRAFDRDYDEYRRENQSRFHNEFASWRTERQGQRDLLNRVDEHAEVVGADGEHVGTVDKVRGDRIILTKNDADAGGRHHSIPSRWLQSADGSKVTLRKTAVEAKAHWRDEERNGAMFGDRGDRDDGRVDLNRSFSGTY